MNLLNELREAMARLDATITHPDMKGVDDRPPEGDDYNALAALVEDWLRRAEVQLPDLEQRLRDIAAGARSKADLLASKSPTSVYTDPVDVLRALAKEAEQGLGPDPDAGLEIQRTLVASTAHLPRQFREWLDAQNRCDEHVLWEVPPLAIDQSPDQEPLRLIVDPIGDYGWRICVTEGLDEYTKAVHSHDPLLALLRLAQKHHCQWLALDRDGDEVDGLPTFED